MTDLTYFQLLFSGARASRNDQPQPAAKTNPKDIFKLDNGRSSAIAIAEFLKIICLLRTFERSVRNHPFSTKRLPCNAVRIDLDQQRSPQSRANYIEAVA